MSLRGLKRTLSLTRYNSLKWITVHVQCIFDVGFLNRCIRVGFFNQLESLERATYTNIRGEEYKGFYSSFTESHGATTHLLYTILQIPM